MIDTLEAQRGKAAALQIADIIRDNCLGGHIMPDVEGLAGGFSLLTLHRPSNVDDPAILTDIVNFLTDELTKELVLLWTVHPRTEKQLKSFGLWDRVMTAKNLVPLRPLGYHELLRLNMQASMVLTDSGGLQEECCVLGTPCLTFRWNTERPVTLREHGGASILVGNDIGQIRSAYRQMLAQGRTPSRPELWDGLTAPRIVAAIVAAG
jgi:UDP-N-acetylglucosamine 2-epimerase (non-hydrolysing)